jgi:hypothetical protein
MMSAVVLETCWGDNVIYILQNKKQGASSWSQKIDLHHDARSEKHKNLRYNVLLKHIEVLILKDKVK